MKTINYLASIILCLSMGAFFMGCDPKTEREKLSARIYSRPVAQAELVHLSTLDPNKLLPGELLEKRTREVQITELMKDIVDAEQYPYGAILSRNPPPPTPCPDPFACLGLGNALDLFVLEIFYQPDSVDENVARKGATQDPSVSIQIDSQHVFAVGKLETPGDPVFKTARFTFAVIDSSLESKDLVMKITTTILKEGKALAVEMNVPVPADTFSAD